MKNELAGIKVGELDRVLLLDPVLKNADVVVFQKFDGEKHISFIAEEVAASWRLVPGYLLKVRSASQEEFKKHTSRSLYQNVDIFICQSLAEILFTGCSFLLP